MAGLLYKSDGQSIANEVQVTTGNLRKLANDLMRAGQKSKAIDLLAATLARVGEVCMKQQQRLDELEQRLAALEPTEEEGH